MKKIPSIFIRPAGSKLLSREPNPEAAWVFDNVGHATRKWDGTACLVEGGRLFRRYDAKNGKTPPPAFRPAQERPDPNTGHWPGWLPVGEEPESKHHLAAWIHFRGALEPGTYELCGPHFQANPERCPFDMFLKHGTAVFRDVPRDYDGLVDWFVNQEPMEGLVFYAPRGDMAKVKAADLGLNWPRVE